MVSHKTCSLRCPDNIITFLLTLCFLVLLLLLFLFFFNVFPPPRRKYNSLIQAQARELSHLRQRMREGQGVCHILTQHLGDTTKVPQACVHSTVLHQFHKQPHYSHFNPPILTTSRPLRSCCELMILITTWARASENSWRRASPCHKE